MNVGIYGGSFADNTENPSLLEKGWPAILSKKYNTTNYAQSGSSLFFNYKQFLDTNSNHNKIIFIESNRYRWYVPLMNNGRLHHISGIRNIDQLIHKSSDRTFKEKLKTLKRYFAYLYDETFDTEFSRLMIDEIKRIRPDVIFVSSYITSVWQRTFWKSISNQTFFYHEENNCICHLSEEYNVELAHSFTTAITTNEPWVSPSFDQIKHTHPVDYYYINE